MEKTLPPSFRVVSFVLPDGQEIVSEAEHTIKGWTITKPYKIYTVFVPTNQGMVPTNQLLPAWPSVGAGPFQLDDRTFLIPPTPSPKALVDAYLEATTGLKLSGSILQN